MRRGRERERERERERVHVLNKAGKLSANQVGTAVVLRHNLGARRDGTAVAKRVSRIDLPHRTMVADLHSDGSVEVQDLASARELRQFLREPAGVIVRKDGILGTVSRRTKWQRRAVGRVDTMKVDRRGG